MRPFVVAVLLVALPACSAVAEPADSLLADLRCLMKVERSPDKAKYAAELAKVFRAAEKLPEHRAAPSPAEILSAMQDLSAQSLPADALPLVRRLIADHLNEAVGTDPQRELSAGRRKEIATVFARVATDLEALR